MQYKKNLDGAQKIIKITEFLGISSNKFADIIGFTSSAIYEILKGKTKDISPKLAESIIESFPQFSRVWLLTGEGDMLNNGQQGGIVTSVNMHNSTNSGTINNGQQGGIVISADVWEVIQQQSASLAKKDSQIDRLIDLMERQAVKE